MSSTGAEARHEIANLLHRYTDIADRKDVPAVLALLGGARVRFPTDGYERPEDAGAFFGRLWGNDTRHRHDVSNLVVEPGEEGAWRARAHYSRWVLGPDPVLHTLGEYELVVADASWSVRSLTVTRTWTAG